LGRLHTTSTRTLLGNVLAIADFIDVIKDCFIGVLQIVESKPLPAWRIAEALTQVNLFLPT
jgi:hypothetical protein